MKYLILLMVLGVTATWPEGRPNCNISGEWGDPEGAEVFTASMVEKGGNASILEVNFNSTRDQYRGTAPAEDKKAAALKVNGRQNDTLLLHLLCLNDVLWVLQTPLNDSPRMMRMFAFRRRLPTAPLQDTTSPAPSSTVPQFILVNISLPKRQEDDHMQLDDYISLP